ncbi:MAG: hypothetical protein PHZ27_06220 [Candidatus Omnitrophica bacterium]|nr:hypothetical protein [Candidatus Omnitrophota bacterium]
MKKISGIIITLSLFMVVFSVVYAQLVVEDNVTAGGYSNEKTGDLKVKNVLRLVPIDSSAADAVEGAIYYNEDHHYPLYYDGTSWKNFGYSISLGPTTLNPFVNIVGYGGYNDWISDYLTPFDKNKNSTFIGADSECPDGSVLTGFIIQTGNTCGNKCSYSFDFKKLRAICRAVL